MSNDDRDPRFTALVQAVIDGDVGVASRLLTACPDFATRSFAVGATRGSSTEFFYESIAHYCYRGDTALHMACAAFQLSTARLLVRKGAALGAKNRRGAEPLHYAADANRWHPSAQSATITYLLSVGADVNARDANGATPLHRAVRTRSAIAVRALLAGGADVRSENKNGSTPFDLATRTTGRGGSGSPLARQQQTEIVTALLEAGAHPTTGAPTIRRR
jgi:hypothetical protein